MDSHLCTGHRDARLLDYRVVDLDLFVTNLHVLYFSL